MTVLTEGDVQINFPGAVNGRNFDDSVAHGLSHCMKAVDFIVELTDRFLFIEIKDPQQPAADSTRGDKFVLEFLSGKIDESLKYKFRDSFIYEWASGRANKPIYYLVLIGLDTLTSADLLARTDDLKRKLPLHGPADGQWKKTMVADCAVFNIAAWNSQLPKYPVSRLSPRK